jgi:hypothetical protein
MEVYLDRPLSKWSGDARGSAVRGLYAAAEHEGMMGTHFKQDDVGQAA